MKVVLILIIACSAFIASQSMLLRSKSGVLLEGVDRNLRSARDNANDPPSNKDVSQVSLDDGIIINGMAKNGIPRSFDLIFKFSVTVLAAGSFALYLANNQKCTTQPIATNAPR